MIAEATHFGVFTVLRFYQGTEYLGGQLARFRAYRECMQKLNAIFFFLWLV